MKNKFCFPRSTFFHYGLSLEGHAASVIDSDDKGEATLSQLAAAKTTTYTQIMY